MKVYFLLLFIILKTISFSQDIKPDDTLPVELIYFYGEAESNSEGSNGKVKLYWGTATEVNNYGYDVERSLPQPLPKEGAFKTPLPFGKSLSRLSGRLGDGLWEVIGFIPGHGNSNSPKDYYFEDTSITANGDHLYRLKQIDTDGVSEYSDTINVKIDFVTDVENNSISYEYNLSQNYPNPCNPKTSIEFSLPEDGYVSLIVYDILGSEIINIIDGEKNAGKYRYPFNGDKLTSGIYFYKLTVSKNKRIIYNQSRKLVLMR